MPAYYNEFDPYAAKWLCNLIAAGHIAPGDVDERSIVDVCADDLRGYTQCHFFAGIGGWSYAMRLAGWSDDRSVWTGSCPCQPFSAAGAGKAADDERHLWPAWFSLIAELRPAIVFGEQVEAAIGWGWLDAVFSDLEAEGYACGATILPACGVGAPHIRQRLWFVADADQERRRRNEIVENVDWPHSAQEGTGDQFASAVGDSSTDSELANADGRNTSAEWLHRSGEQRQLAQDSGISRMEDAERTRSSREPQGRIRGEFQDRLGERSKIGGMVNAASKQVGIPGRARITRATPWADLNWLPCTDGKARPVEPGTFPLAHGIPGRVGRLRAYGNAIVAPLAAEFIGAFLECRP